MNKTAIILFNLGGPDSPKAIKPFLFNLFYDRAIIDLSNPARFLLAKLISSTRAKIAIEIYNKMGGKSPILEQTEAQSLTLINELKNRTNNNSEDKKVFISMRYWHPMSDEVARDVKKYNPDKIILLPLYPQFSTTTTKSSFDDWYISAQKHGLDDIETIKINNYCNNEKFIFAHSELINKYYNKFSNEDKKNVRILFSAHGLPEDIVSKRKDPYPEQIRISVEKIVENLSINDLDYKICYQSKVGPKKWLSPSIDNEIIRAGKEQKNLIIVPIAFVSEHSETLVELDIEYRELAEKSGVKSYKRVPTLQTDENFIAALADMCIL